MAFFLGGMRIVNSGWMGYRAVFVDFVSSHRSGFVFQLYANRTMIGRTTLATERRIIGQLVDEDSPAPLTLIRVDSGNALTDYGPQIPQRPWNRFNLQWSASSFPADAACFEITGSTEADGAIDPENVIARVPFNGDGAYQYALPPIARSGDWQYAVTPRDNSMPLGNAGTSQTVTVAAVVPPPDVVMDQDGKRFTLTADEGVITAEFVYGS